MDKCHRLRYYDGNMERSDFNISGKNLNEEEREKVAKHYEKTFQEGREPVEGELLKSEQTLRFIEVINNYLNEELRSLDLREVNLDLHSLHILTVEGFEKKFPDSPDANGIYRSDQDAVYVEQSEFRMQTYKSLLHEIVHQLSYQAISANQEIKETYVVRSGYTNMPGTEKYHEHFRGLNEAIIDSIVKEIFMKHKDDLIEKLDITQKEQTERVAFYDDYISILKIVMEKIAEKNNEDKEVVWKRFKKGEFTGEMMHLREVERAFGEGALRVLAALGSGTKIAKRSELIKKMQDYFKTDDTVIQQKIAKEILIERENLRYGQRKNQHLDFN